MLCIFAVFDIKMLNCVKINWGSAGKQTGPDRSRAWTGVTGCVLVLFLVEPAEGEDVFGSIFVLRLDLLIRLNLQKKKKKKKKSDVKQGKSRYISMKPQALTLNQSTLSNQIDWLEVSRNYRWWLSTIRPADQGLW